MKFTARVIAICALSLTASLLVFSQESGQQVGQSVALKEMNRLSETPVSKNQDVEAAAAKRQSNDSENWKGFYIGGNVGGTTSNHSLVTSTAFCGGFNGAVVGGVFTFPSNGCYFAQSSVDLVNRAGNQKAKPKGFTGGVQAGYNFQAGKFVAGVEADFNSAHQNKTVSGRDNYTNVSPQYPFQVTQTIKTDWLMTVRPRAGVAVGRALIYGTGGLAVTNVNYQMNFEDFPANPPVGFISSKGTASTSVKETKAGWTAGAGAEFKINDSWSFKGEYLYTQFNADGTANNFLVATINSSGGVSGTPQSVTGQIFTSDVKLKSHHFRFGINYRF